MKDFDKLENIVKRLKENKPELTGRENLTSGILKNIQKSGRSNSWENNVNNSLFGWTHVSWLRKTMSLAAMLLIGVFVYQQITINERINRIEKRLIKNFIPSDDASIGIGRMQQIYLEALGKEDIAEDSITVSASDLNNLLDAYLELEEKLEKTKRKKPFNNQYKKTSEMDNI